MGRIHGAALGGGVGLLAVCDIAVAVGATRIGFPEVRLGLVPGVIAPYVQTKIGPGHMRHLFLTGERIDARRAFELGLVRVLVEAGEQLDGAVDASVDRLLGVSPQGVAAAKRLVHDLSDATADQRAEIARRAIAAARASEDGREGTQAFLEKRKPGWTQ